MRLSTYTMGSQLGLNQPEGAPRYWYRDHFLLTTDKSLLDASVVNAIFDSDLMWWNEPMQLDMMQKMLDGCLTIAIYAVPETADQMKSLSPHYPSLFCPETCAVDCGLTLLSLCQRTGLRGGPTAPS